MTWLALWLVIVGLWLLLLVLAWVVADLVAWWRHGRGVQDALERRQRDDLRHWWH